MRENAYIQALTIVSKNLPNPNVYEGKIYRDSFNGYKFIFAKKLIWELHKGILQPTLEWIMLFNPSDIQQTLHVATTDSTVVCE